MATVSELYNDRTQAIESSGQYSSLELFYLVKGVEADTSVVYINGRSYPKTTEWTALDLVRQTAPTSMYGMARKDIRISAKISETSYKVGVTYQYNGTPAPDNSDDDGDSGDRTITFNGTLGSKHITHSFYTQPFGNAPSNDGAINVDNAGNINGVDVASPAMTFSETHYMTYKKFKISYIRDLFSVQGKVNAEAFRGFDAGEVRFDGFTATRRGSKRSDLYELVFNFSVIPNQPEQNIHGLIAPAKAGWDYIWFKTRLKAPAAAAEDGTSGGQGSDPGFTSNLEGGYIERVYERANFSLLQIKTVPFLPVADKA